VNLRRKGKGIKTKNSRKITFVLFLNFTEVFTCGKREEGVRASAFQ
jgi:hypothetical protein